MFFDRCRIRDVARDRACRAARAAISAATLFDRVKRPGVTATAAPASLDESAIARPMCRARPRHDGAASSSVPLARDSHAQDARSGEQRAQHAEVGPPGPRAPLISVAGVRRRQLIVVSRLRCGCIREHRREVWVISRSRHAERLTGEHVDGIATFLAEARRANLTASSTPNPPFRPAVAERATASGFSGATPRGRR